MIENWKAIIGYEGRYEISDMGRVKSLVRSKILSGGKNSKGYMLYKLYDSSVNAKSHTGHKLVMEAFVGPRKNKDVIDHIDENRKNNKLSNLRYTTNRFNCSRSRKGGASKYTGVFFNKQFIHKVWCATIQIDGKAEYLGAYHTEIEASNAYQQKLKEKYYV